MNRNLKELLAAGSLSLVATLSCAAPAAATVYVLNLSGMVANATYSSFISGGQPYQVGTLDLGFGGAAPITLMNGDELQVTVALDGPFAVPGTVNGFQFFGLNFNGSGNPAVLPSPPNPEVTTGTITFSGGTGAPTAAVNTDCGNCLSSIYGVPGPASPYSFTGLVGDSLIQSLASPFTINDVSISYQVNDTAVPEPATWAMMLFGFGLVGLALRARPQQKPAVTYA